MEEQEKYNKGFEVTSLPPVIFHNLPKDPILANAHTGSTLISDQSAMTPVCGRTWNLLLSSLSISLDKQTPWAAFHLQRHLNKDAPPHRNRWQMFISSPGCSWAHPLSRLETLDLLLALPPPTLPLLGQVPTWTTPSLPPKQALTLPPLGSLFPSSSSLYIYFLRKWLTVGLKKSYTHKIYGASSFYGEGLSLTWDNRELLEHR